MRPMRQCTGLKDNLVTHKDKNPVSVRFPTFSHLLVFFRSHFHIHRENGTRAINKVALSLSCFILRWRGWVQSAATCCGASDR